MTDTELLNWLEEKAKKGYCPALVNDDNGHWAVSFKGIQAVGSSGGDVGVYTSKYQWKDTIRGAIEYAFLYGGTIRCSN